MLILNTTYYVPDDQKRAFLQWLADECIPRMEEHELLHSPRVLRMMGLNTDEQTGIAVQFGVATLSDLREWHNGMGEIIRKRLATDFGGQIEGFSTMMEVVDMNKKRKDEDERFED